MTIVALRVRASEKRKKCDDPFSSLIEIVYDFRRGEKSFFQALFFSVKHGTFCQVFFFFFSFLKTGGKKVFAVSEQNLFSPVFTDKIKISSLEK